MALQKGTRLGAYEIISPLGAGGMGEVYRARDTKLQRDVALKILPESMARDAQRMARFEREARTLASLNHPNIAAIYGLEESNGVRALVMELVDGETLAEKISVAAVSPPPGSLPRRRAAGEDTGATTGERCSRVGEGLAFPRERGALPYQDALPIAKQIAEALEYAHERGVIHRDLKPANVKITPEGTVKVLDFGLAKVLTGQDSSTTLDVNNSPTLSTMATQAGMILGTAAYMSPEQAKGQRVDRRGDIWAFGCVLYEMLSGRKPFDGETISDVLAAVIRAEPDWAAIPETTPPSIQRLVRRCLQKDVRQRLQAIGDARIAIEETISGVGEGSALPTDSTVQWEPKGFPYQALPWVLAGVLAAALVVALSGWWPGARNGSAMPEWSGNLLPGPEVAFFPRVSPDGHLVAFETLVDKLSQVAVTDPRSGNWTVLTHDRTLGLAWDLSWSPDGSKIYFDRYSPMPAGIYSVPALGGESRLVLANAACPRPLPDGSMLVVRVDPGGEDRVYHYLPDSGRLQGLNAYVFSVTPVVHAVPGGKKAVFFGTKKGGGAENSAHLYVMDIDTGNARVLAPDLPVGESSRIVPLAVTRDGRSVLTDYLSGNLWRVVEIPLSGRGRVRTLLNLTSAALGMCLAPDGSIYVDQVDRPFQFLRISKSGGVPDVLFSSETGFGTTYPSPVEASDGRVLILARISGRARLLLGKPGGSFISLLDTNDETAPPLAQLANDEVAFMLGSPPSQSLAIASLKDGHIIHRFDSEKVKDVSDVAGSPDGRTLYYVSGDNVWSIPGEGGTPRKICRGTSVTADPDGRHLIVALTGQKNVHLERIPLGGGQAQAIEIRGNLPLAPRLISPNAINKEGQLLVSTEPTGSWFFGAGILDLSTDKLTPVPLNYEGDLWQLSWSSNGQILATGSPMLSHIWRFRPITDGKQ